MARLDSLPRQLAKNDLFSATVLNPFATLSPGLSKVTGDVLEGVLTVGKLFDGYRPELHYMRGPGPKWNAKHNGVPDLVDNASFELPLSTWLLPAATAALLGLVAVVAFA
jgi:hypothetical protein